MENRIYVLRKEHGYSQEQLAHLCRVSRQTINAIENNKYDPTLNLAFTLAQVLGTTVDDLFQKPEAGEQKPIPFPGGEGKAKKAAAKKLLTIALAVLTAAAVLLGTFQAGTITAEAAEEPDLAVSEVMEGTEAARRYGRFGISGRLEPEATYRIYTTELETGNSAVRPRVMLCCRTSEYGNGWILESVDAAWMEAKVGLRPLYFNGVVDTFLRDDGILEYSVDGDFYLNGSTVWTLETAQIECWSTASFTAAEGTRCESCLYVYHHEFLDYTDVRVVSA